MSHPRRGVCSHLGRECVKARSCQEPLHYCGVAAAGVHLLHKPLKPLALKSLMARLLAAA